VKRSVVFLGYYMFLLSQTIKEKYLRTHLVIRPKKIPIPVHRIPVKYHY
jgi:hypothetical protein